MPLELIHGPPNSGRAGELVARLRSALDRQPVLVVPTADDVAAFERELCAGTSAVVGASATTFAGLAREVARALTVELGPALSPTQRRALVRAAIRQVAPRRLRRSAARPGFTPAVDRLIAELQAALVDPGEFAAALDHLDGAGHEGELAAIYSAYIELRDRGGRSDSGLLMARSIAALREDPGAWGDRPVLVYGFDDLTRDQTELIARLRERSEVTIAVTYADSRALAARAGLLARIVDDLGASRPAPLPFDPGYTTSATLRHLDRNLFEPGASRIEPDAGLTLLDSAGPRGEAEAIGIEIARLLASGFEPGEIAIVVRHPDSSAPLLASVLASMGIPVAADASIPLTATATGTSLLALCRAAGDETALDALLTHMRCDTALDPGSVDWVERRIRQGAATIGSATAGWSTPPRHLARLSGAPGGPERLLALARSARELAEGAHRREAPLATRTGGGSGPPFSAVELRAGVAAAELLSELAALGRLAGDGLPDLPDAIEALESTTVELWRGPASGRVRIMSPYRARTARVRALFCAGLVEGEFPSASPPDPLLSEERRAQIGNPDLRRADQAEEERYLFHSCVSRPTERLYLSWQSCDEDGTARARSPFVDEVCDLLSVDPARSERLLRVRGPDRAVPDADEATTTRALARALAVRTSEDGRRAELERLGIEEEIAAPTLRLFDALPDPNALPGPLRVAAVVGELGARRVFSANSLEGWVTCSYRWFVDHELRPQRLDPAADPLWLGAVVHGALERLYRDPPGTDTVPRHGDVARWRTRFGELLAAEAEASGGLSPARRSALDRARIQVEAFLEREAETESEFRPARELLELGFGSLDHDEAEISEDRPALPLGELELRGRIDRIDLARDGRSAIIRDYKTGKSVPRADDFADRGTLQIQLYMLVARRVLGLDPVAGLYQPLGAADPGKRRARGVATADDPRLDELGLVNTDRKPAEDLERLLADAESRAIQAAEAMRAGRIRRDPINGECPRYCTFQPICRLERALGAVGAERSNGGDE